MASTVPLCQNCQVRPRYYDSTTGRLHSFCGKTCANTSISARLATSSPNDNNHARVQFSEPVVSNSRAKRDGKNTHTSASPTNHTSPSSLPSSSRPRILFYHKHEAYYGFTNFSPHAVCYKKKRYPTSEHLFQSLKFTHKPKIAEHIRACDGPSKAFSEARVFQSDVRTDWKQVNIRMMDLVLWHKFSQHRDLRSELLGTGDAELIENSDKDSFWGIGKDGQGRNELGKALERLRTQLRENCVPASRRANGLRNFLQISLYSLLLVLCCWLVFVSIPSLHL